MHTECWRWPHHRSIQPSKVRKAQHPALMDTFMFPDYIYCFDFVVVHRLESTIMHRFSHPGVFTVSAECSTSDWRVTAEKTITIQEPVRDLKVIRCYSTNLSADGAKCTVLSDRPVHIQVTVDQGQSVQHQITLPQKLTIKNCIMR